MKRFYLAPALFIVLTAVRHPGYCSSANADDGWTEVKNRDGIGIFTKQSPDSPIVLAKGLVIIEASPEAIVEVLDDNGGHTEWIPYLLESRRLEAVDDRERLEYNLFDAPWPASDRDFVFRVTAHPGEQQGRIVFRMKSETSPLMPERDGIVRGVLLESTFRLTRLGPDKTRVELLFQADPKGWIPLWVVNIVQRAWPFRVLQRLRERVAASTAAPG
ncbi:MAG TPA: hypothetical protein ENI99_09070 [Sedimenticola sp.]|nr:hypothetical protein [Sedimenticola sp.]